MRQLFFLIGFSFSLLKTVDACEQLITLRDEKVQRITISDFSQVIDVVQMLKNQGISQHQMICAQDWDCYITDDYFTDSVLRHPEIPKHIERLKELVSTFILTGRWIDKIPEFAQVERVIRSLDREFIHSSFTLSPYDVFHYYHGIAYLTQDVNLPKNPSQRDVCRLYAETMQRQSGIRISNQNIFQNLEIDLRSQDNDYGYFVDGFCFTNGQINPQLKAKTLTRLLDNPRFPAKDILYVVYGDDDLKYIDFLEEFFRNERKERLISLYYPNPKSQ